MERSETILLPLLGIALTCIGYGPFSMKKNPSAGVGFAVIGFMFRLAGPLLLVAAILMGLFAFSMSRPPHQ
jgi:Na+/melibiose symporter-like transporter